jgi:heat shock protein HslJ
MRVALTARAGGILTVLAVGLLVTACGGGASSSASDGSSSSGSTVTAADLDGSAFESTSVEGHDLVAGSTVRLTFEGGSLSATAGCNTLSSTYDVTDGRLAWTGHPMTTMMGCPDDLAAQDTWLSDLLEQGADATLDGDDLTLVSGDVTLQLQRRTTEPAAALLGTTWTVTAIITGKSVAALPSGATAPTIDIAADGKVQLFTGCNRGHTTVTTDGDSAEFAPAGITRMACPPPADQIEQAVLMTLDGQVAVTVDGSTATLTNGRHGLVLQAG